MKITRETVEAVNADKCDGCGRHSYDACPRPGEKACFREFHGGQRSAVEDEPATNENDPCGCIGRVNALLKPHNTLLVTPLFGPAYTAVETTKYQSSVRGKAKMMIAKHCPFCGAMYPRFAEAVEMTAAQ